MKSYSIILKRIVFFISIYCLSFRLEAQNNSNEMVYKSDSIYLQCLGSNIKTGEFETALFIPFGTNGSIIYNDFFKSYKIKYTDVDGLITFINLHFIKFLENGDISMADYDSVKYTVTDEIQSKQQLFITAEEPVDGKYICTVFIKNIH